MFKLVKVVFPPSVRGITTLSLSFALMLLQGCTSVTATFNQIDRGYQLDEGKQNDGLINIKVRSGTDFANEERRGNAQERERQ